MFHRINLEADKLKDARLLLANSKKTQLSEDVEIRESLNDQYQSFVQEADVFFRTNKPLVSFLVYLLLGSVFYYIDYNRYSPVHGRANFVYGFYQAITIGYSVGLSPKDPNYTPDPWFSSAYILVGAGLKMSIEILTILYKQYGNQVALNLVTVGRKIEDAASNVVFDGLKRREDYEKDMSHENPFHMRTLAFIKYNAPYLIVIVLWILWLSFITVWSTFATINEDEPEKSWNFAYAQYFAISLCSSAGSFSLPSDSATWAYGLAGVSMMFGVPLMALAISSIVIMFSQGHRFKKVKKAAWEPVQPKELEAIKQLGLDEIDNDTLTKGGFVLLGLLRMGQDSGIIQYLADAYDASEERGGVVVSSSIHLDDEYSKHARAYLDRAASDTERPQEDRRWSVAALKDQNSNRGVLDTLTERLLDEDMEESNLMRSSSHSDVMKKTSHSLSDL